MDNCGKGKNYNKKVQTFKNKYFLNLYSKCRQLKCYDA